MSYQFNDDNWGKIGWYGTTEKSSFDEDFDRMRNIGIIMFSVVAVVMIVGIIVMVVCYCCAGCMLYKRYRTNQQTGGTTPGYVITHQVHPNMGGPPVYPAQQGPVYPTQQEHVYPTQQGQLPLYHTQRPKETN